MSNLMSDGNPQMASLNPMGNGDVISTPRALSEILLAVSKLARKVDILHRQNQLHLEINWKTVRWEDNCQLLYAVPQEAVEFGGISFDAELCPPALQTPHAIKVSSKLSEARRVLEQEKIPIPPEAIDLYQMGTLLCRLITHEPVSSYFRSPRTKSQIPPALQPILDRALGQIGEQTFPTLTEFAGDLAAVARTSLAKNELKQPGNPATEDTTPSILVNPKESDTSQAMTANRQSPVASDESLPFLRLGHFEILERIGHGGMGDVYKGYERSLDRTVAIKVLPVEFSRSDDFVRRFYAEATAAARLLHSNIIQIYSIGEDQGCHFFAMQFVEGESLADRLAARGNLSLDETLDIIEQALAGLSAAHERGLVHRDIKPGNILLDAKTQRAYLADFGLVKSLQEGAGLTATGMVMGTVDYISPEQGRGLAVDARADLYSLGVVLYRMLSGRLPFEADSPTAMIFQHVYESPKPLKEVAPQIPATYSEIVGKLLAKKPEDRYPSAGDVLLDLKAAKEMKPLPSGADIISLPAPGSSHAQSATPSLEYWSSPTAIIHSPEWEELAVPGEEMEDRSHGWRPRLKNLGRALLSQQAPVLYESLQNTHQLVDGAVKEYEDRQHLLEKLAREAETVLRGLKEQSKDWEDAAGMAQESSERQRCHQAISQLKVQIGQQEEQFSEIREQLGRANAQVEKLRNQRDLLNARLKVARARITVAGGKLEEHTLADRFRHFARLYPWQALLICSLVVGVGICIFALTNSSDLATQPLSDLANETIPSKTESAGEPPRWDNVSDVKDYPRVLVRLPLRQFIGHEAEITDLEFSPDNALLASGSFDRSVRLWNVETGERTQTIPAAYRSGRIPGGYPVGCLAMAPHARLLAFAGRVRGGDAETIQIWNLATGEFDRVLPYPNGTAERLAWSADGQSLLAVVSQQASSSVSVFPLSNGNQFHDYPLKPRMGGRIAINQHGNVIVRATGEFNSATGQETTLNVQRLDPTRPDSLLADSFELKFQHPPEQFPLTEVEKGVLARTNSSGNPLRVSHAALSPDGTWAATAVSGQGAVLLWNLKERRLKQTLMGMEPYVQGLCFSPDGRHLAVASRVSGQNTMPDSLYVWDVETGHLGARMQSHSVKAIALSPDGKYLATATADARLMLFDAKMQAVELDPPSQTLGGWTLSAVSKSGRYIAAAGTRKLGLFSAADARLLTSFHDPGDVVTAMVSPNDRCLVSGDRSGRLIAWGLSGQKQREFNVNASRPKDSRFFNAFPRIKRLAFAPDGDRLLVATSHDVLLWNVITGQETRGFLDCPVDCEAVAVSPDGRFAATAGEHRDQHTADMRIWDFETGKLLRQLPVEGRTISSLAFSNDGHRLASGENGKVSIWDVDSGRELEQFTLTTSSNLVSKAPVGHLVYLADDDRVALTNDNSIQIWEAKRNLEIIRYRFRTEDGLMTSFSISAAGGKMVTSNPRGMTSIWDLQTGIWQSLSKGGKP